MVKKERAQTDWTWNFSITGRAKANRQGLRPIATARAKANAKAKANE